MLLLVCYSSHSFRAASAVGTQPQKKTASTSSNKAAAQITPVCTTSDLQIHLGAEGATGAIVPAVRVTAVRPCRLVTDIRLLIKSHRGKRLAVSGNPASVHVDRSLRARRSTWVAWFWRNWCAGAHGKYVLLARASGLKATSPQDTLPRCDVPGTSSTLSFARKG